MGGIYLHMILAVHLRFFFVVLFHDVETRSRALADPTRIVLVYENRSTNIERISLEISSVQELFLFIRLASIRG